MAKFDGSSLKFDWYLGGTSFEESGADLSDSYDQVTYTSRSQIRARGVMSLWGKRYQTKTTINGSFGEKTSSVSDVRINYGKGELYVSDIKGISLDDFGNSDLDRFNAKYLKYDDEIIASSNNDRIDARKGDDYVFGNNGDDTLIGGSGDDLLVGSKGIDFLAGGSGEDWFGVSKKDGKGKNNMDIITDFEVGDDILMVAGTTKGMWIDNHKGDAVLVHGNNDVIAWIEGAGGKLDWGGSNGNLIM